MEYLISFSVKYQMFAIIDHLAVLDSFLTGYSCVLFYYIDMDNVANCHMYCFDVRFLKVIFLKDNCYPVTRLFQFVCFF